ncbi:MULTISPECIES: conjugative transposon protein TraK [Chitinophagaceae]
MKNIDTAFRYVRMFTIVILVGCLLLSAFVSYKSYELASLTQKKIYVLADGKVLEAYSTDTKENLPIEARDHIKTFHQLFFTLSPDEKAIQSGIKKALYLADGTAKNQYDDLKESNYYTSIISGNISQQIAIDSIALDDTSFPIRFKCFARLTIIRPTTTVERSLVTEGDLRRISRSENNPHGFLIERWLITENRDLNVTKR